MISLRWPGVIPSWWIMMDRPGLELQSKGKKVRHSETWRRMHEPSLKIFRIFDLQIKRWWMADRKQSRKEHAQASRTTCHISKSASKAIIKHSRKKDPKHFFRPFFGHAMPLTFDFGEENRPELLQRRSKTPVSLLAGFLGSGFPGKVDTTITSVDHFSGYVVIFVYRFCNVVLWFWNSFFSCWEFWFDVRWHPLVSFFMLLLDADCLVLLNVLSAVLCPDVKYSKLQKNSFI